MKKYEVMFIMRPEVTEEKRNQDLEKFKNIIASEGEVLSVEDMGLRKLAYEIEKVREGYYYLINYKALNTLNQELERNMRISDDIMRFIVVNQE
jgi:small subunit ribosomal protein S6